MTRNNIWSQNRNFHVAVPKELGVLQLGWIKKNWPKHQILLGLFSTERIDRSFSERVGTMRRVVEHGIFREISRYCNSNSFASNGLCAWRNAACRSTAFFFQGGSKVNRVVESIGDPPSTPPFAVLGTRALAWLWGRVLLLHLDQEHVGRTTRPCVDVVAPLVHLHTIQESPPNVGALSRPSDEDVHKRTIQSHEQINLSGPEHQPHNLAKHGCGRNCCLSCRGKVCGWNVPDF